jgi:hypothetical protein
MLNIFEEILVISKSINKLPIKGKPYFDKVYKQLIYV